MQATPRLLWSLKQASMLQPSQPRSAMSCPVAACQSKSELEHSFQCSVRSNAAVPQRKVYAGIIVILIHDARVVSLTGARISCSGQCRLFAVVYSSTPSSVVLKLSARCNVLVLPNAASAARATLTSSSVSCHSTGNSVSCLTFAFTFRDMWSASCRVRKDAKASRMSAQACSKCRHQRTAYNRNVTVIQKLARGLCCSIMSTSRVKHVRT